MSLNVEGSSCVVCHAYLFPEDDIVYCPVCGAPHHRDCYHSVGHCRLEEFHGTPRQYDKIKDEEINEDTTGNSKETVKSEASAVAGNSEMTTCQMCHESYGKSLNSCPKCGSPNVGKIGGSFFNFNYDFLGGVPADYDLGEGVTADEAKRFVVANTPRYIPKFATLNKKNRASWNWAAFLFPCGWMLSRKMYKNGIIAGLLTVISVLLLLPFNQAIYNLGTNGQEGYVDILNSVYQSLPKIGTAVVAVAVVGAIFNLAIRIVSAVIGDYFYKNYAVATIKSIKEDSEDMDYDFRKKGGVNFFMFILGIMAVEYLPMIIYMFI